MRRQPQRQSRRQSTNPRLDQLFGSTLRVRLLRLLLDHPLRSFTSSDLQRQLHVHRTPLTRELDNVSRFGIVTAGAVTATGKNERTWTIHTNALLYPELKAFFMKARLLIERALVQEIERLGSVRYLVLTGFFVGDLEAQTDLFIVGKVNRKKIGQLMRKFERELQRDIRYTIMSKSEFKYRHDITDRFLYHVLENPRKIVVIDALFARVTT